jgi:hypothetical protein
MRDWQETKEKTLFRFEALSTRLLASKCKMAHSLRRKKASDFRFVTFLTRFFCVSRFGHLSTHCLFLNARFARLSSSCTRSITQNPICNSACLPLRHTERERERLNWRSCLVEQQTVYALFRRRTDRLYQSDLLGPCWSVRPILVLTAMSAFSYFSGESSCLCMHSTVHTYITIRSFATPFSSGVYDSLSLSLSRSECVCVRGRLQTNDAQQSFFGSCTREHFRACPCVLFARLAFSIASSTFLQVQSKSANKAARSQHINHDSGRPLLLPPRFFASNQCKPLVQKCISRHPKRSCESRLFGKQIASSNCSSNESQLEGSDN